MKKSFAIVALVASASAMAAESDPLYSFRIPPALSTGNKELLVAMTLTPDAKIRQTTDGRQMRLTPCRLYAASAFRQADSIENYARVYAKDDPAYADQMMLVSNLVRAEKAALEACQKSASPGPVSDYKAAKDQLSAVEQRVEKMQQDIKPNF